MKSGSNTVRPCCSSALSVSAFSVGIYICVHVIQSVIFSLICEDRGWSFSFHLKDMLSHECECIANFMVTSDKTTCDYFIILTVIHLYYSSKCEQQRNPV